MTPTLIILYVVTSLFLGIILLIDIVNKKIAAVCYCLFLVIFALSFTEASGPPKDIRYEWRNLEEATLVGMYFDEPKAIYVWVLPKGSNIPKSYVMPWSKQAAEEGRKAAEESKKNGKSGQVKFKPPKSSGPNNNDPVFYAAPQPELPAKTPIR